MIEVSYDFNMVGFSYMIAVFGSFTALQLAIRIPSAKGKALWGWLAGAAVALGGGAIWSMHFIGMLAYKMPMEVDYDPVMTIGSLILAVVVAAIGLFIVGRGQSSIIKLIVAGVAGGLGVCGMHYTGMAAMIMPAEIRYDYNIVGLSVVIAIVAATAALWLAFNLRGNLQRIGSALVMGVAVCGMHYTGMSAMTMVSNHNVKMPTPGFFDILEANTIAILIFAITCTFLIALLVAASVQTSATSIQEDIIFE